MDVKYRKFVNFRDGKKYYAVVVLPGRGEHILHRAFKTANAAMLYGRRAGQKLERLQRANLV